LNNIIPKQNKEEPAVTLNAKDNETIINEKKNHDQKKRAKQQYSCLKPTFKKIKKSLVSNYITDIVKDILKIELLNTMNKTK
jgi:hypothetical protein